MKLVRAKDGYRKAGDKWLIAKKCTCCGKWLVASTDNFNKKKTGKYGLHAQCKECRKQYRQNNKEKIIEQHKQYYEANKEKIAEYRKQWYEANRDKISEYGKQYYENNKDRVVEWRKQYYQNNKDKILEQNKQYRQNNKEKIAEQQKQWSRNNKDKVAEIKRRYRQSPKGQVAAFNDQQRRCIKEEQQGSGITKDQWLEMMKFFDFRCAYSGETLTKDTRSVDHIVPLNSSGEHEIWNCVPMTRSLNSSKQDKDMLEWYKEQSFFSEARLEKIYEWQEYAYNKWEKGIAYVDINDIQI